MSPELPSCGETGATPDAQGPGLAEDVDAVRRVLTLDDEPTLVVAHSYGGIVASEAVAELPNVTGLVLVSSYLPMPGESLSTFGADAPPPFLDFDLDRGTFTARPELFAEVFAQDCPPDVVEDGSARLVRQSLTVLHAPVRVAAWRMVPTTYLVCTNDRGTPPSAQREFARRADTVIEIGAGHHPFLSHPGGVADLITHRRSVLTMLTARVFDEVMAAFHFRSPLTGGRWPCRNLPGRIAKSPETRDRGRGRMLRPNNRRLVREQEPSMPLRRRFVSVLTTLGLVLSAMITSVGTAAATDNMPGNPPSSCSGSLISGFPKTKNIGSRTLKLYVYYSSANGGTNCAIARKSGSWAGKSTYLSVTIWRSDVSSESSWPYAAYDFGNYKSYAGAAYITHTNGKCINVIADYGYSKDDVDGNMGKFNFACG